MEAALRSHLTELEKYTHRIHSTTMSTKSSPHLFQEATQLFIHGWMNKQNVVMYKGLFHIKKKNMLIHYNMDEPGGLVK